MKYALKIDILRIIETMIKFPRTMNVVMFLSLSCISLEAKSEDINILAESVPSEIENLPENRVGGVGGEVLTEALKANNITFKMVWTRWKVAQQQVQANKDKKSFIVPLTRNPEREAKYNWVAKIYEVNTVFFIKKGNRKINFLKEIEGKKIGVLLESSYEQKIINAKGAAFKNEIASVPYDNLNARKLLTGEIDAWYDSIIGGNAFIKNEKLDRNQFEYGNVIDKEDNYIATTNSTSSVLINKVKNAIETFKKTKKYSEIINKYFTK